MGPLATLARIWQSVSLKPGKRALVACLYGIASEIVVPVGEAQIFPGKISDKGVQRRDPDSNMADRHRNCVVTANAVRTLPSRILRFSVFDDIDFEMSQPMAEMLPHLGPYLATPTNNPWP